MHLFYFENFMSQNIGDFWVHHFSKCFVSLKKVNIYHILNKKSFRNLSRYQSMYMTYSNSDTTCRRVVGL